MKTTLIQLASILALTLTVSCAEAEHASPSAVSSAVDPASKIVITLGHPEAGIDYPTDSPFPTRLAHKKILAVNETARIVVAETAKLKKGAHDSETLVLDATFSLPVTIEAAKAGLDFPTDGPAGLDREFLVWSMGEFQRVRLNDVDAIEKAVAGVDYPTDGPADLDRDFYVYVSYDAKGGVKREVIEASRQR